MSIQEKRPVADHPLNGVCIEMQRNASKGSTSKQPTIASVSTLGFIPNKSHTLTRGESVPYTLSRLSRHRGSVALQNGTTARTSTGSPSDLTRRLPPTARSRVGSAGSSQLVCFRQLPAHEPSRPWSNYQRCFDKSWVH